MSSTLSPPRSTTPTKHECTQAVDRAWSFALAGLTFLGAFLLFQVQPLIGKAVLPWFGGAPGAWIVAMLFFQIALVGGYALVYLATKHLSPRTRTWSYVLIVGVATLFMPILPAEAWKHCFTDMPIWHMLLMLSASVGGPYLALAMTGPIVQEWHHRVSPAGSPYRLYALSNLGSLLGLVTYPFLVEPALELAQQATLWSSGYVLYTGLACFCAWKMPTTLAAAEMMPAAARNTKSGKVTLGVTSERVTFATATTWLLLAAGGSILLLATTNHLCEDVPSTPLMWIGPMIVYLLSFIVAFDKPGWYRRGMWGVATMALTPIACAAYGSFGTTTTLSLLWLFVACLLCHGELVRRKPPPAQLTLFYLVIAAGGALGGIAVGVLAPLLFDRYWEWMLGTTATFVGASWIVLQAMAGLDTRRGLKLLLVVAMLTGVGMIIVAHRRQFPSLEIDVVRNFYGVVSIDAAFDEATQRPEFVTMRSGVTLHGAQYSPPQQRREPTTYYGRPSGIGHLLQAPVHEPPRHVGLVGLGSGTLATYGRRGDTLRFYEINPAVVALAQEYFTFLRDTSARTEMIVGDARLSLEQEASQEFDVLVLDAFTGDSIPTHLLTREAFEVYLRHLRPTGILAVHCSNVHLDLPPVIAAAADHYELAGLMIRSPADSSQFLTAATWVLLTRDTTTGAWQRLVSIDPSTAELADLKHLPRTRLWTDHYSNLLTLLK